MTAEKPPSLARFNPVAVAGTSLAWNRPVASFFASLAGARDRGQPIPKAANDDVVCPASDSSLEYESSLVVQYPQPRFEWLNLWNEDHEAVVSVGVLHLPQEINHRRAKRSVPRPQAEKRHIRMPPFPLITEGGVRLGVLAIGVDDCHRYYLVTQ